MRTISFADVVHHSVTFRTEIVSEKLVLDLVETSWVQRLRDVAQTANTRLVYMFSEHSRFGHCLGTAYLACQLLEKLERLYPGRIEPYKNAVTAAALLHDVGHLAPGSHIAQKLWFPDQPDSHERLGARILSEAPELTRILNAVEPDLSTQVARVLSEDSQLPPWTWQLVSGGGWNVDRGNWCIVDSIMAGVDYGKYNIPAVTDSIRITDDDQLALRENRLDAMMHFAVSRHAMYTQMYQHRVILSADALANAVIRRARTVDPGLVFADEVMGRLLAATSIEDLSLEDVLWMREAWWRYHLLHWQSSADSLLSDLATRLVSRKLFKTVLVRSDEELEPLKELARTILDEQGLDPAYYLHEIGTKDVHKGDKLQSMLVQREGGSVATLQEAIPLFDALVQDGSTNGSTWLALPHEVKRQLEERSR